MLQNKHTAGFVLKGGPVNVSDPTEDDGRAVQDAALWLHCHAAIGIKRLGPVHLKFETNNKTCNTIPILQIESSCPKNIKL